MKVVYNKQGHKSWSIVKELVHRTLLEFVIQPGAGWTKTSPHIDAVRLLEVRGDTKWEESV